VQKKSGGWSAGEEEEKAAPPAAGARIRALREGKKPLAEEVLLSVKGRGKCPPKLKTLRRRASSSTRGLTIIEKLM